MNPTQILAAYSRQEATQEQVLRAFMSYDGWLVETRFAVHVTGRTAFQHGLILGEPVNIPAGQLWFYMDEKAATLAVEKGARLGTYHGGIPGTKLFAALPMNYESLSINPGCPQAETFFIPRDSFAYAALWARAVEAEQQLARPTAPDAQAVLRDYPGFIYFTQPEQDAIVTALASMACITPPSFLPPWIAPSPWPKNTRNSSARSSMVAPSSPDSRSRAWMARCSMPSAPGSKPLSLSRSARKSRAPCPKSRAPFVIQCGAARSLLLSKRTP